MAENVFFSIGIPVYNAERYLRECVDSILSQSFSDFELILVDDGSSDSSAEICDTYAVADSRVRVIHQQNGGISSASNKALEHCTGKYLFLMDNDDVMCEGALENAYRFILEKGCPDLIRANYYTIAPDGSCKARVFDEPEDGWYSLSQDAKATSLHLERLITFPMWHKFIRLAVITDNNLRFEDQYSGAQDADFSMKTCRFAQSIAFADFFTIYWYNPRVGSVSSTWKYRNFQGVMRFYRDYIKQFSLWDLPKDLYEKVLFDYHKTIRNYTFQIWTMQPKEIEEAFSFIDEHFGEYIRKMPVGTTAAAATFLLYRLFGVKRTARLLMMIKGVR